MIRPSHWRFFLLTVVGLLAIGRSAWAQTVYSDGDPSAQEQLALEMINRARANPAAEGQRLGQSDFANYPARPPLAFNADLLASARGHDADEAANNYFSHTGSDGSSPFDRMFAAGYPDDANVLGENISVGYPSAPASEDGLMIDTGISDLGHRRNLLNFDVTSDFFREFGGVYDEASTNYTQDFGARGVAFITGVAFRDTDGTDFYSEGAGVAGVTVSSTASSYVAVTSTSGGYALPMDGVFSVSGGVTVTFTNADGMTYSHSLALTNTTGDGAVDNVECNVRVGIDLPDTAQSTVSLTISQDTADAATGQNAVVKCVRTGGDLSTPLTVSYKAKGAAVSGTDYKALSGTLTIPAGSASAKLKVKPLAHDGFPDRAVLKIVVQPDSSYLMGAPVKAKVALVHGQ